MKKTILSTMMMVTGLILLSITIFAQNNPGHGVVSSVTPVNGSCAGYTPAQGSGPDNYEVAEGGIYTMTITGVTECSGSAITVFVQSSGSGNWCFNATGGGGTYSGTFTMPSPACYTMPISYKCGANQPCEHAGSYDANGPSNNHKVHLRVNNFNGSCVSTGVDDNCNSCIAQVSISANKTLPLCPGECVTLTASGADTYIWSNDETGSSITVCEAGTYHVVGRTAAGCVGSSGSITVSFRTPPTVSISANGPTGVCSPACVTLSASGADYYVWSPNGETTSSISACSSGDYSVVGTDEHGCSAGSNTISVEIYTPPTVRISPSNPNPICDGECVTLTASGAQLYVWSTGDESSSISACVEGNYSVTGTDEHGCTATSENVYVRVNPKPSCDIIEPALHPVYGLPNNPLSASVDCPTGCNCSYAWSVSSSDNSWMITSTNGLNIVYTAGNNGTSGLFKLIVTCNQTGCKDSCYLEVTSEAQEHCAYTQGFYGNTNGMSTCLGLKAPQAVNQALNTNGCNPIVLGYGNKTLTFACTDASCITSKLPSGSTAAVLPCSATCATATGSTWLKNGRFDNVLIGQTLTLAINIRLFPNLGNVRITSTTFTTYQPTACINGNAIAGTGQTFSIPQSVISCLGSNNKICDLLALANKRLGSQSVCTNVQLSDIVAAIDAINNGFDKCRINSTATIRMLNNTPNGELLSSLVSYPNPTSGDITVDFTPASGTHATVEIFSSTGSRVAKLFDADITIGENYKVKANTLDWNPGIYFLNLRVGDQSVVSKVVVMKQ